MTHFLSGEKKISLHVKLIHLQKGTKSDENISRTQHTYRIEIQMGVDLLIIGDKGLIVAWLVYGKKRNEMKLLINDAS